AGPGTRQKRSTGCTPRAIRRAVSTSRRRLPLRSKLIKQKNLQVIPLGGLREFGMNMTAIRYGVYIHIGDPGMMFPSNVLLGVDVVMPDLTFLKENREHIKGLVLTHGHEDHIGAVPYLLSEISIPVYGTAFTIALVERRMEEYDLEREPVFLT